MLEKLKKFLAKLSPDEQTAFLKEVASSSDTGEALPAVSAVDLALEEEVDGEYETRHQEVTDHVSGVTSMQPVRVSKSALNFGLALLSFVIGSLFIQPAYGQATCPTGTQVILRGRNSVDLLDHLFCYDPVNRALSIPSALPLTPPQVTDAYVTLGADNCWMTAATTAFTAGPALVRAAAGNTVLSATTNTTGGTVTVTCPLEILSRTTAAKGATINSIDIYYGVQTTALSSIAAATLNTVTYPATGGAASGTVAAAGGSLTATPGTLQLTTTTTGQCFHENVSLGTPFLMNSNTARVTLEQQFTTAGTTATTLQICAVGVNISYQY